MKRQGAGPEHDEPKGWTSPGQRPADMPKTRRAEPVDGGLVERVALVLSALGDAPADLGATAVARMVRLHPATVHRLLQSLARTGLVEYIPSRRTFALGERILELGIAVQERLLIRAEARPALEALREITGETAMLWARTDSRHVIPIDQALTSRRPRRESVLGNRLKLHHVLPGQIVLAHESPAFIEWYLGTVPLDRVTQQAPSWTPESLAQRLAELRDAPFFWHASEAIADVNSLVFVLRNAAGLPLGAIHIFGPAYRWTRDVAFPTVHACVDEVARLNGRLAGVQAPFTWATPAAGSTPGREADTTPRHD